MKTFKVFLESAPSVDKKTIADKKWWENLAKHLKKLKVSKNDELFQNVTDTIDNWDDMRDVVAGMGPKELKALEKQIKSK